MDYSTYYQKNRDIILKRAKDYYYSNIDTIRKNMRDKYKNLSKEDKEKMKKYQKNYRGSKKLQLPDSLSDSIKRPSSSPDEAISKSSSI